MSTSECGPPRKLATDAGAGARADVAVTAGIITVTPRPGSLTDTQAGSVLDASGRAVSPGSIDAHIHGDLAMFLPERWWDITVAPLRQGVTTEVRGNCGLSPFSRTPQYFDQSDEGRGRELQDWTSGWLRLAGRVRHAARLRRDAHQSGAAAGPRDAAGLGHWLCRPIPCCEHAESAGSSDRHGGSAGCSERRAAGHRVRAVRPAVRPDGSRTLRRSRPARSSLSSPWRRPR